MGNEAAAVSQEVGKNWNVLNQGYVIRFVLGIYSERLESQEYLFKWAAVQEAPTDDLVFRESICSHDENEGVQNAFLMLGGPGIRAEGKQPSIW